MADANIGTITARLTADSTEFIRNINLATQALTQFQQQVQSQSGQVAQGMQRAAQGTQVLQQQLQLLNQQAISQTGFLGQMAAGLDQLRNQFQQAGQAAQQSTAHVRTFGETWRTALAVAGGVGLATSIQGIVSSLKDFAVSTVEVGARMESLRNSLSALGGSSTAGQQQFDQLFQTAQRLGIAFEPLARGFRQITAAATQAGVPIADQMRLLTALATEARRVGISNEEMGRSVTAVAQIFSKGKVSMEELRQQLGEALPTAMAAFARGMGRSVEEVEKLVEAGVSATRAGAALTRGFEAMQREGGPAVEGLQQAFNRFGNEVLRSKDLLTQMLGPLASVAKGAADFLKTVNDLIAARAKLRELEGQAALSGAGLRPGDVGRLSAEEQARLKDVQSQITGLSEGGLLPGTTMPAAMRESQLEILRKEQAALIAKAQALKESNAAQEEASKADARARDTQTQTREAIAEITKQVEALRKTRADLRREAEAAPELYGRERGTLEEQTRFQKELESRTKAPAETLVKAVTQPGAGVTIPAETQAQVRAELSTYGEIAKALDAIKDKKEAATKAARDAAHAETEAARLAKQAVTERLQIEEQLRRAAELSARPSESLAEQAGAQARRPFETASAALEKSLVMVSRNPNLADLAERIKAALAGLGEAAAEQSQIAFDRVVVRQQEQTRQMGDALQRIAQEVSGAGLTPLQEAMTRVTRTFAEAGTQLDKLKDQYTELSKTGSTPEIRESATAWLQYIEAFKSGLPALEANAKGLAKLTESIAELDRVAARSKAQYDLLQGTQQQLDELRQPRDTGQEAFVGLESQARRRIRQQAERTPTTPEGRQQLQEMLEQMRVQERLNYTAQLFEQFAGSVGNAWTQALTGIADGTKTVSEAFREMGRSILQTLTQMASQEAWKALIGLGVRLITGAVTSGAGGGGEIPSGSGGGFSLGGGGGGSGFLAGLTGGGAGGGATPFQHGGVVNRPTLAMIGEAGPEYVVPQRQMQALMSSAVRAAPTAGGQAAGVTVINVASEAKAQETAAQQRAMGRQVVINHVLDELSQGESSKIGRLLRTTQR